MKAPRIYIAGKLEDSACNYIKNVHKMIRGAEEVRKEGFAVFIPGIDLIAGLVTGTWNYKDYFDNSQPWLDVSDGMYVLDNWRTSTGTIREMKRARDNKTPTFFQEKEGVEQMKQYFFGKEDWVEPFIISKPRDLESYIKRFGHKLIR